MDVRYVVRGAQVKCNMGSTPTRLNLPKSHGVYINEKPLLIDSDTLAEINVMPFGKCKKRKLCKPALVSHWENTKADAVVQGRPALITCSVLNCTVGGKITIKTDGQQG